MAKTDFDKNMTVQAVGSNMRWYDVRGTESMELRGLGFYAQEGEYCRLPLALTPQLKKAREHLCELQYHTAGVRVHFCTNSARISVRVRLRGKVYLSHMTPCGQCGFDCYAMADSGEWRLCGIGKFDVEQSEYECLLACQPQCLMPCKMREYCVELPLYMGIYDMAIGLDDTAEVLPPAPRPEKSVAFFGTSITQGGCAARPGTAYPALLQKWLDAEVYNLGFSGNGVGTLCLAEPFCSLAGLSAIVLSFEANSGPEGTLENDLPSFIAAVRALRPTLPILVLSAPYQAMQVFDADFAAHRANWLRFQENAVISLQKNGDSNIQFANAADLIGKDIGDEASVDGVHLTDLGFYHLAKGLLPIICKMLGSK